VFVLQSVVNFDVAVPDGVTHHHVSLEDEEDANLLDELEDAVDFIDDAIGEDGKVLVHCQAGVSRSASVVIAYMGFSMGLSAEEALEVLRMNVPQACPNAGFMRQIKLFVKMGYDFWPWAPGPPCSDPDLQNRSRTGHSDMKACMKARICKLDAV
jgi:dual specificity phosphatase 12